MNFLKRAYGLMGDEPDESAVKSGLSKASAAAEKLISDIRMYEQENGRVHQEIDALASMVGVRIRSGSPSQRLRTLRSEVESRLRGRR